MDKIKTMIISGGTHGNELTGVQLIKKWTANPELCKKRASDINLDFVLVNPSAVAVVKRYVDHDLNRSFADYMLHGAPRSLCVEWNRAQELNQAYGPKGDSTKTDLIIDIHNTESNMGVCLILSEKDAFTMRASAEIANEFSGVHIYFQPEKRAPSPYFGTIARADICVEVGPQSHGTLRASLFEKTEQVIYRYLELAAEWNAGLLQQKEKKKVTVFTQHKDIDYPRDRNGNISAMIHSNLQNADYAELKPGDPLFRTFEGNDILFENDYSVWPLFINEAAYYEKKIAMSTTLKSVEEW